MAGEGEGLPERSIPKQIIRPLHVLYIEVFNQGKIGQRLIFLHDYISKDNMRKKYFPRYNHKRV